MKTSRSTLFVTMVLIAFAGCTSTPRDEVLRLQKVDSFELYSLEPLADPDTHEMDFDPDGPGERLHGWRVLGKTTVSDEATRRELIEALKEGMERPDAQAKCFYPRHAIRSTDGGKTVDLLICFECHNVQLYRNGRRQGDTRGVAKTQAPFDEALRKAGVPLAKRRKSNP
jgi:hypothetical protein